MEHFIERELIILNIRKRYAGHKLIKCVVLLVIENEDRLRHVIRDVYEPTALRTSFKTKQVERTIRPMIFKAWDTNRVQLNEIAGTELMTPPTVSEFIEYLADYVKENCTISV